MDEEKESGIPETIITAAKLKKLRNLKYFRDWTDDQVIEWVQQRKKNDVPPVNPNDIVKDIPSSPESEQIQIDEKEWEEKFTKYLNKYRKEFGIDMNDANDAESLRSLVRYIIQLELINKAILQESRKTSPHPPTLKSLGDFQRVTQQSVNDIQDKLGISRKARKEKQVDDIPQYVKALQQKAKAFWERSTTPIRCEKCRIELARYWVNFPDTVNAVHFELKCDKCKEKIIYSV